MREAAGNFDFMELGQAIMDAREKQRITREELAEELGISARHFRIMEQSTIRKTVSIYHGRT